MSHIISIHSYRGGTGKSNLTANLAWLAAREGRRVALLDTDLASPGVHLVLGLQKERMTFTLSDFVFGRCDLEEAAYDMTAQTGIAGGGALYLLPSSMNVEAITRVVAEGYDVGKLNEHFAVLGETLGLDLLFIDTHPGLNRETMLTTAVSDTLVIVVRPDRQDYHGTAVMVEVAARLRVPRLLLLANKVPRRLDAPAVAARLEQAFGHEVLGVLPLEEDMACLGSEGLFARLFPEHPLTAQLMQVAERLLPKEPGTRT
ncbi:MAG: MinD/ParA family protein [Planctomycetes bacterium]|nr:MinD/ParA family protein [Planctomycetota bacterium]